jgi:hypothetical protein
MAGAINELVFPHKWRIIETLGPVFSAGGFKNWDFCLAHDAIVLYPRGFLLTVKAGIIAGIAGGLFGGAGVHLPGSNVGAAYARQKAMEGERILLDAGSRKWRRYLVTDLEAIKVKKVRIGYNEIRLQELGTRPYIFGIGDHAHTNFCRRTLSHLYPRLYEEVGFPTTLE